MKALCLITFLVSPLFAQSPTTVPPVQSACGAVDVQFQTSVDPGQRPEPEVDPGKALIYVVEDQKFKFVRDVTVRIGVDGAWVGATRGNSYLFFSVEPGEHHLCVDWMKDSGRLLALFALTAEAGKAYYFRARTIGGPASSLDRNAFDYESSIDLDLINSDQGKLLISSLSHIISRPKK